MLFNSYIFILFFLPMTLILYFGLNKIGKEVLAKWTLVCMSLWFYSYFHVSYLFLITGSVLFNFTCSRVLVKYEGTLKRKIVLAAGIAANLGTIFYFKYFNFFLENINGFFHTDFRLRQILMPLGISFFTFQQISYLVDSYRLETRNYHMIDYVLFVTFFPQLIAGPIVLHDEMIPQLQDKSRKKLSQDKLASGIYFFTVGLFKKVMIADTLSKGVDWGFANPEALTAVDVIIVSLMYTLQLYFDFSGYSDMACGIANMFHFELPVNFRSPYKATSIHEFWQRWHITLTRFLRKYLYFPLGGSRKGEVRTLVNLMLVFLVSGIWHGAGWTFILWGAIHGMGSVLYKISKNIWDKFPGLLRWAVTFLFVDLTWIFFRSDSLSTASILLGKLVKPWKWQISGTLLDQFNLLEFTYVEDHMDFLRTFVGRFPFVHMFIVLAAALLLVLVPRNCHEKKFVPTAGNAIGSVILLLWSVVSLSGLTTFLYFNF